MLAQVFCSYLTNVGWLQNYLLKCPFKKLTGFDCPGCGFQRSVLSLLQGDLYHSLALYPATIPIILLVLFSFVNRNQPTSKMRKVKKALMVFTVVVIAGAYLFKLGAYYFKG